jgi:transposase
VLAKHGIRLPVTDRECQTGTALLDQLQLPGTYADRLASQRRCLLMLETEIGGVEVQIDRMLRSHPGYRSLLKIRGLGSALAAIFLAEIGDVSRFPTASALA